jgi:hypothetical protein
VCGPFAQVAGVPDVGRQLWYRLGAPSGRYEVENFTTGPMCHCDSVVENAEITLSNVSRRLSRPGDFRPGGMSAASSSFTEICEAASLT